MSDMPLIDHIFANYVRAMARELYQHNWHRQIHAGRWTLDITLRKRRR